MTDNRGATGSATTTATITPSPPTAPNNLDATSPSSGQARVTWSDRSNNETSFKIERSTSSSSGFSQIATVGANVRTYTDSDVTKGRTYYYRVRASNSGGNSSYSNVDGTTIRR